MCNRCGKCCKTNPCDVSQKLYQILLKEVPDLKMERTKAYLGCMSPVLNSKRICIYYEEIDGKANCKLVEKSKLFRRLMLDGSPTFACQKERMHVNE